MRRWTIGLTLFAVVWCAACSSKPGSPAPSPRPSLTRSPAHRPVAALPPSCTPKQLRALVVGPLAGDYQVNLINMDEHESCSLAGYPRAVLAVSSSGAVETVHPRLYPAGHPKPVILRERSVTANTPWAAITLRGAQLRLDIYFDCTHLKQGEHGTTYSSLRLVLPTGTLEVPYDIHASSAEPWHLATYCGAWTMHTFESPVPFTWEAPAV